MGRAGMQFPIRPRSVVPRRIGVNATRNGADARLLTNTR